MAADIDGPKNSAERFAILDSRTTGVERAINKLEMDLASARTRMDANFERLEVSISTLTNNVQAELAKRDKPQWQLIVSGIGVMLTFLLIVGGLVYAPIKTQIDVLTDQHTQMRRDMRQELKSMDVEKIDRREVDLLTKYRDLQAKHADDRLDRIEGVLRRHTRAEGKNSE